MSARDELLEYVDQLVVVPRVCDLCLQHTAVMFWMGSWPYFHACRGCWENWRPTGEMQPWVTPIGAHSHK